MNGYLYQGGGALARIFQGLLILFGLYYVFIANTKYYLPVFFKGLNLLLAMFTIYGVALIIVNPYWVAHGTHTYLKFIYIALLPVYPFYVFAKTGQLTEKNMRFWYILFLFVSIYAYNSMQARLLTHAAERGSSATEFTLVVGYHFAALLPGLVLFRKKPVLQYILLAICGYYIISAMKRGAILCGAVCILWFFISNWKSATYKQRKILIAVTFLVVLGGTYYVNYMLTNSRWFQHRVEQTKEGDDSNRTILYSRAYNYVMEEEDFLHLTFGNGAMYSYKAVGGPVHQDWLEIALCQGVLGVLIYLIYFICYFISWRRAKRYSPAFMAIGMSLIVYGLSSCFSMSYSSVKCYCSMVIGYYLAIYSSPGQYDQLETAPSTSAFDSEKS